MALTAFDLGQGGYCNGLILIQNVNLHRLLVLFLNKLQSGIMNQFFSLEHFQIIAGSDAKLAIPLLLTMRSLSPHFGTFSFYLCSMITHYCQTLEEALKKAKQAGKQPGCEFWGITLSGQK